MTANLIITTSDGSHSLRSERFDVNYHSVHGAIQESEHVFIQAALAPLVSQLKSIRILEMGFGSGLNACLSWMYAQRHEVAIYYETIEPYPITVDQARLLNYPELLEISRADFMRLHTAGWDSPVGIAPDFTLCKWSTSVQESPLNNQFDIVYYDAFAPTAQPELWEADVLQKMYDALSPGGVFVTYCAKGVVKRCLRSIGFLVEGIAGPPGKREMIRATKPVRPVN